MVFFPVVGFGIYLKFKVFNKAIVLGAGLNSKFAAVAFFETYLAFWNPEKDAPHVQLVGYFISLVFLGLICSLRLILSVIVTICNLNIFSFVLYFK